MILVTDYLRNDIDGVACIYAYSELLNKKGIDAVGAIFGKPHSESQFVIDKLKLKKLANAEKFIDNCDGIILVDASDLRGISPKIDPSKVVEIIDHRAVNDAGKFPNAKIQIELVGSAATLVAEKFLKEKIPISKEVAFLLGCAIVSNTINFRAGVTTKRDREAFKWLNSKAKISKSLIHAMFAHKSKFTEPLLKVMKHNAAFVEFGGKKFCIIQLEIVDAEKFVSKNLPVLKKIMKAMGDGQDFTFLTCIDIEKGSNLFVAADSETENFVSSLLKVKFSAGIAKRKGVIMRKEITPLIKERME